jgi:hypothetical protein
MQADLMKSLLLQQLLRKCNKRCKSLAQGGEVCVRPGGGRTERDGGMHPVERQGPLILAAVH